MGMIEEMVDGVGPLGFFLINTLISMVPVPAAGVMCLTAGAMFGLLQGLVIYFVFFFSLSLSLSLSPLRRTQPARR